MEALHARYPFLAAAREAVGAAEVDLGEIVREEPPVVNRATERVRTAIEEGTAGDPHRTPRVELLSYPVARVLVSLVGESRLSRRYARAEADSAIARLRADVEDTADLQSVRRSGLTLEAFLGEFDLADAVEARATVGDRPGGASGPAPDRFGIDVAAYLDLSGEMADDGWRLVDRAVDEGTVTVTREELYALLREAVRARIEEGLPLEVPEEIADALAEPVADLRERLADREPARDIDRVDPGSFPPCMTALLERVSEGESLPPHSRFSLTAFLATIGMDEAEIVERYAPTGADEGAVRAQIARLREGDGPAVYPPPSCATMQAYGDCVNMDDLCERIVHPLDYYERRLDGEGG